MTEAQEPVLALPPVIPTPQVLQVLSEIKGKIDAQIQGLAVTSGNIQTVIQQIYGMSQPTEPVTDPGDPVVGKIEPDDKD